MTDGSHPPHGVLTLRHKYFDLKSSEDGHIIHGIFVCIELATRGPSVDITYMCSNKDAKSILTKIAHCPSAWWYWHWVEKGYTQGTIASLLNSFESDVADNAHDSTYDPQSMTVTSMFAGDDKNQLLDQVEEEFGSDLSDHEEDMIGNSGTTIELGMDAKASLAKEMKGKDYNLEGVNSCSSKKNPSHQYDWQNRHDINLISHYKEVYHEFQPKQKGSQCGKEKDHTSGATHQGDGIGSDCWDRPRWKQEEYGRIK
jgi:hypothetical protein